jgi:hypothetical protein
MKPRTNLLAAVTVLVSGALGMGCYEEAGIYEYDTVGYDASPTLVAAGPGLWMVSGQSSPMYYSNNYYWMSSGNNWYRSSYYNGGWASVNMSGVPNSVGYYHTTNYGSSQSNHRVTQYVGAQPHVAGQVSHSHVSSGQTYVGAHPHVSSHVSSSPRVYTGQTHVGHSGGSSFGGGGHSFGGGGHSFGGGGHSFGGGGHGHR